MMGMMGYGWGVDQNIGGGFWGVHYGLGVVTWIVVIAFLVAATRYLWKKGGR